MSKDFSRRELYAFGLPFGESATRMKPGGRGRIYGGGGGGGGVKYDNLEQLYGLQAQQAQSQLEQYNTHVAPAYNEMLDQAKGYGSIANQEAAAGKAAADVESAQGGAKKQLESQLTSLGVNPADQKYGNTLAAMDLDAAAQSASAQTGARERTRQYGDAAVKDAVSLGMGISSNATSALNGAGNTASNIAGIQQNNAAMSANNTANIAALGTRLLGFKCGGLVRPVRKYASGGFIKPFGGITPPPPPPSGGTAQAPAPLATATRVGLATTGAGGLRGGAGIESLGKLVGNVAPETGNAIQSFGTGVRLGNDANGAVEAYKGAADAAQAASTSAGANAASTAGSAAGAALDTGATASQAALAGDAAATAAGATEAATAAAAGAETLGVTSAAMGAGAGMATALSAAMPWVGGALLLGSALNLFADGGEVVDHTIGGQSAADGVAENRTGGDVKGPGGPKDDMIEARLSPGEFVMPVGAVKLFGLKELENMRARGLRYEKQIGIH